MITLLQHKLIVIAVERELLCLHVFLERIVEYSCVSQLIRNKRPFVLEYLVGDAKDVGSLGLLALLNEAFKIIQDRVVLCGDTKIHESPRDPIILYNSMFFIQKSKKPQGYLNLQKEMEKILSYRCSEF